MNYTSVLFFLPDTGTRPYLNTLAVIAQAVTSHHGKVFFTKCGGLLRRCSFAIGRHRDQFVTEEQKKELCNQCNYHLQELQNQLHFSVVSLENFLDPQIYERLHEIFNIPVEFLHSYSYQGIPLGKIAYHDTRIATKCLNLTHLTGSALQTYREIIYDLALVAYAYEGIVKALGMTHVVTFNPYSSSQVLLHMSRSRGISYFSATVTHNCGADWSLLQLDQSLFFTNMIHHCRQWKDYRFCHISSAEIHKTYNDALFKMFFSSSHVFSPHKQIEQPDLLSELGLDFHKKTIVAFTSSPDELLGLEDSTELLGEANTRQNVFPEQMDWLLHLQSFTEAQGMQCVLRIHPREGQPPKSEHLLLLEKTLAQVSPHCRIIWPDTPISSYDLMELADLAVFSTSTMGIECARMGVPTLTYCSEWTYAEAGHLKVAHTLQEYEELLSAMPSWHVRLPDLLQVVRFYAWMYFRFSLDMGETVPHDPLKGFPHASPNCEDVIVATLNGMTSIPASNISNFKAAQKSLSLEQEILTLKQCLRQVIQTLFFGIDSRPDSVAQAQITQEIRHLQEIVQTSCLSSDKLQHISQLLQRKYVELSSPTRICLPDYFLQVYDGLSNLSVCRAKTQQNSQLICIVRHRNKCLLCKNGKIYSRISPMLNRLAGIHAESEKFVFS